MNYVPPDIVQKANSINVEEVAKALGINVFRHQAICFMHDDHSPSLKFHKGGHLWKCFVCNKGGGAIDLVRSYLKIEFKEAVEWLCNRFGISFIYQNGKHFSPSYQYTLKKRMLPKVNIMPLQGEVLLSSQVDPIEQWIIANNNLCKEAKRFLFYERKLSTEVIDKLKISSISSNEDFLINLKSSFPNDIIQQSRLFKQTNNRLYLRFFTPCLIFPYFNEQIELLGIQSRYLGERKDVPRFQFLEGFRPIIFNLPILSGLRENDELIVAEGVTDCLALLSEGYKAIAMPSANNIPLAYLKQLCKFRLRMTVDKGEAGENAFRTLRYHLLRMGGTITRFEYPGDFKDFADYHRNKHTNDPI